MQMALNSELFYFKLILFLPNCVCVYVCFMEYII